MTDREPGAPDDALPADEPNDALFQDDAIADEEVDAEAEDADAGETDELDEAADEAAYDADAEAEAEEAGSGTRRIRDRVKDRDTPDGCRGPERRGAGRPSERPRLGDLRRGGRPHLRRDPALRHARRLIRLLHAACDPHRDPDRGTVRLPRAVRLAVARSVGLAVRVAVDLAGRLGLGCAIGLAVRCAFVGGPIGVALGSVGLALRVAVALGVLSRTRSGASGPVGILGRP